MKTTIREFKTDFFTYSMHDATMIGIEKDGDTLTFKFNDGFMKEIPEPPHYKYVKGMIEFTKVDWISTQFFVTYYDSKKGLKGWQSTFEDFNKLCKDYSLTVMDEYYGYNTMIFEGFVACEGSLYNCSIRIFYKGEMKYITEE